MAIVLIATITAAWIPDGASAMEVPSSQQLTGKNVPIMGNAGGPVTVPGGNNPSAANITTALSTLATQFGTFFESASNLAIIQGWQNGTG